MKAAVKKRWVDALRSGKYLQGQSELNYTDEDGDARYCCLGVLRHVIDPEDYRFSEETPGGDNTYLSADQLAEYGLRNEEQNILAEMNDSGDADFNVIADYIEKNIGTDESPTTVLASEGRHSV